MSKHSSLLLASAVLVGLTGCVDSYSAPAGPPKAVTASAQDSAEIQLSPAAEGQAADPQAADKKSELSREELLKKLDAAQQRGAALMSDNKSEEAYRSYIESGQLARELKRRFPELTRSEKAALSMAFYNEACALAMTSKVDAAFPALKDAFETGFTDLDLLDRDTDLAAVRALPGYEAWRKDVETKALQAAQEEVRRELADFKTYPFDFTLNDLDDKPVKLADFKGKVVIADIWGTWCPPCRAEIPSFVKLQEKYRDKGLQIVGLNYERGEKDQAIKLIRDFQKDQKMNYLCLLGDDATREQVPSFEGYPTTIFIDRTGKVRLHYVGLHPYTTLEATVLALLNEPAP